MPDARRLLSAVLLSMACSRPLAVHAADGPTLPPADAGAKQRLEQSPRHGEWSSLPLPTAPLRVWTVHPERSDKAPVVIVIHEIFGLTDWVRAVADQLAADGFIAVAPDLLSGKGPLGGGSDAFASRDDATRAVSELDRAEVTARLNAVREWALKLPNANGRIATVGFCWGGAGSFAYAAAQPALDAAVVFYGTAPEPTTALTPIRAPVLGLYGGADARVTATVDATRTAMQTLGKSYDAHVFDGAGHGFLRAQDGQDGANRRATETAWPLVTTFLRAHTR